MGRSEWGAHRRRCQERAPGQLAVGGLGKHQPTQPMAEGVGAEIRGQRHVGVALVKSRAAFEL